MATTTNPSQIKDKVKDAASTAADKAKDAASNVADRAGDMASRAMDKAGQIASNVSDKADDATASVGSSIKSMAGSIRESLPSGGVMGAASSTVADTLESSGRYLEMKGLSGVSEDLAALIKRNPIPAVLVGVGVGYLLACATRR